MVTAKLELHHFQSGLVRSKVPYAVVLPEGDDAQLGPLPLMLSLHGGGGSREDLVNARADYEHQWRTGRLPQMVIAMPSTPPSGFYMDVPGGEQWETMIMTEFLPHLREVYHAGRERASSIAHGVSMGGYGALKLAFRHPEAFAIVAAMEPAILPAVGLEDVRPRNALARVVTSVAGEPPDAELFRSNNPAAILRDNQDAVRAARLKILIEAGDRDFFYLHDGTEFLHRLLWDLDIPHEYHLDHGGDHLGPSLERRTRIIRAFIRKALSPPLPEGAAPSPDEQQWVDAHRAGDDSPVPVDPLSHRATELFRFAYAPEYEAAAASDPSAVRSLGVLPPTGV